MATCKEGKKRKNQLIPSRLGGLDIVNNQEGKSKRMREGLWNSGFATRINKVEEEAGREIAVLKATNEALHTRVVALCEQLAGSVTGAYKAHKTASDFVVQNSQLVNKVPALQRTIVDQAAEVESLKNNIQFRERESAALRDTNKTQERALEALRAAYKDLVGIPRLHRAPNTRLT